MLNAWFRTHVGRLSLRRLIAVRIHVTATCNRVTLAGKQNGSHRRGTQVTGRLPSENGLTAASVKLTEIDSA